MQRDDLRAALNAVRNIQKNSDSLADALNQRFRALEQALRDANVRVPASVLILGDPDAAQTGYFLSWGKNRNRWSLHIETVRNWTDEDRMESVESVPVTDAELRLRKLAVPTCPALVLSLGHLATQQADELERANRSMDELLDAIGVDPKALDAAQPTAEPDPWEDDGVRW